MFDNDNFIEFIDKTGNNKIGFGDFNQEYFESPIFLSTKMDLNIGGFKKEDVLDIELLDLKLLKENLKKLINNDLKNVNFVNIDSYFNIYITSNDFQEVKIKGNIKDKENICDLKFEFSTDLSSITMMIEKLARIENRYTK
ncbi:hypothetical protein NHF50_13850 [Flavobacterium sp. NRK F10]|uniref:WapI family immunity protein n=1 Tax=Flavobacterium sp. NRK F10 TaxID=2954931 RepID=UPI0020914B4A|nr:hypothetical protein [Flavobacterium sp. NRK F10]MCO6176131.1 hypothetical protein [Flavobacterium sp. NRK F10]